MYAFPIVSDGVELPCERCLSLSDAYGLAHDSVGRLGFWPKFTVNGIKLFQVTCEVFDPDGHRVSVGHGKGSRDSAVVGALYEALEHLLDTPAYFTGSWRRCLIPEVVVSAATRRPLFADDNAVRLLNEHATGEKLPSRKYRSFTGAGEFYLPYFLTNPEYCQQTHKLGVDAFDYRNFNRYSSNSGTAIGANFIEAALHGLHEVIERDAWSIFLIKSFFSAEPQLARVVDVDTLPKVIINTIDSGYYELGAKLVIFDLTNDIKIPTFCAAVLNYGGLISPYGFGCSIIKEQAIERALMEMVQAEKLIKTSHLTRKQQQLSLEALGDYPPLYRCARFDVDALLAKGKYQPISFNDIPGLKYSDFSDRRQNMLISWVADLLDHSLAQIKNAGFEAFYSVGHTLDNGVSLINVQIPGLERFFIVSSGNLVLPSKRGMEFITDTVQ